MGRLQIWIVMLEQHGGSSDKSSTILYTLCSRSSRTLLDGVKRSYSVKLVANPP
jgi:hypothetical protein